MAVKIINNTFAHNDGVIVADELKLGDLNDQPTISNAVLVHDGAGSVTLQNVTVDPSVNIPSGTVDWEVFPNEGDLPDATANHGMFAHVHATGKGYFAHAGNWVPLLSENSTTSLLAEGTNLYFTSARVNSIVDPQFASATADRASIRTEFATADTTTLASAQAYTDSQVSAGTGSLTTDDIAEASNLYYTTSRANTAIDARVTKSFVDALNIQATSVNPNSVALGTDTTGNYVATVTGTASEIDVAGSGTETAGVTLSLPNNMVVPQNLTVTGNLTVNGTTITNDTSTLSVDDPYVTVGGNTAPTSDDNKDRGVRFRWYDTAANIGFFGFDDSTGCFTFIPDAVETGEVFSGTKGCLDVGSVKIADAVTDNSHATTKLYVDTADASLQAQITTNATDIATNASAITAEETRAQTEEASIRTDFATADTNTLNSAELYTDNREITAASFNNTDGNLTLTKTTGNIVVNFDGRYSQTDTTYNGGTGIDVTGNTITNTAPDQTVVLTGGTNVSVAGTYPNFTISATDTDTTYSAGNGIGLTGTSFSVAAGNGLTQQANGLAMSGSYTGNFTASGDVTAYSDRALKRNIQTIEGALDKVTQMRGVTFLKDGKASTGVIAQEIETVLPEVVHQDNYGMRSVAYGNIVGTLIEAIKEQQVQIEKLQSEIAEMKKK